MKRFSGYLLITIFAWGVNSASAQTTSASTDGWRDLLDEKLTAWELWMGIPMDGVTGLPPGTPTSSDGHNGTPLGLNNDPKHVFTMEQEGGEPLLHISGEIFGGLTTKESFSNYHLQAQMKWGDKIWAPKLNAPKDNGILWDCTGPHGAFGKVWKRCIEFQVEDKGMGDTYFLAGTAASTTAIPAVAPAKGWTYDPTGTLMRFGAAKDATKGKLGHLAGNFESPMGEWNTLDFYTVGSTAVYIVNGHVVQVLQNAATVDNLDKTENPLTGGQIQIQSEGAEAFYRKVRIQLITDFPADIKKASGLK